MRALHDASRVAIAVLRKRARGLQPITHYHAAPLRSPPGQRSSSGARLIGDPVHANASDPGAATLGGNDHHRLVSEVPTPSALFNPPTHVSSTSTSPVSGSRPGRTIARRSLCRQVHAVLSLPIPHTRLQADGTRPVLWPDDPPHCLESKSERLSSVLKDGAGGDGHCGCARATPKELVRREPRLGAPAIRASEALGPFQLHQVVPTSFLRRELVVESAAVRGYSMAPSYNPRGNSSQGNTHL